MSLPPLLSSQSTTQGLSRDASVPLSERNNNPLTTPSTSQSRQVSLLSSASYTVSLNKNVGSYTYSGLQSSSTTVTVDRQINSSSSSTALATNNVARIEAPAPLLDGSINILQFIEQRLASEQLSGASNEELDILLEQGLSGFKQGFSEADAILGDQSDVVSEAITQLYNEVIDGFEKLTAQYITNESSDTDGVINPSQDVGELSTNRPISSDSTNNTINTSGVTSSNGIDLLGADRLNSFKGSLDFNDSSSFKNSLDADLITSVFEDNNIFVDNNNSVSATIDYSRQNTSRFEIFTRDGDRVSIQANNTINFNNRSNVTGNTSAQFGLSIEGDIDEEEAAAIQSLLDEVISLSQDFYNGDIDQAFEKALNVNFNQQEIASFAINLRQTEQFSVAAIYQPIASNTLSPQGSDTNLNRLDATTREAFLVIGEFVSRVLESLNEQTTSTKSLVDVPAVFLHVADQIDLQRTTAGQELESSSFRGVVNSLITL